MSVIYYCVMKLLIICFLSVVCCFPFLLGIVPLNSRFYHNRLVSKVGVLVMVQLIEKLRIKVLEVIIIPPSSMICEMGKLMTFFCYIYQSSQSFKIPLQRSTWNGCILFCSFLISPCSYKVRVFLFMFLLIAILIDSLCAILWFCSSL